MKNKHTAMQQLINEIVEHLTYDDDLSDDSRMTLETIRLRCLGKLSVEKEQIIDSYKYGNQSDVYFKPEQYYIETYESKESDAKDVILGYKTSLDAQMLDKIKLKQETTIEEAAEKYAKTAEGIDIPYQNGLYYGFVEGAKWQAEIMYSEEDLKKAFNDGSWVSSWCDNGIEMKYKDFETWFEQFKK
jgi:hypothetical protein